MFFSLLKMMFAHRSLRRRACLRTDAEGLEQSPRLKGHPVLARQEAEPRTICVLIDEALKMIPARLLRWAKLELEMSICA